MAKVLADISQEQAKSHLMESLGALRGHTKDKLEGMTLSQSLEEIREMPIGVKTDLLMVLLVAIGVQGVTITPGTYRLMDGCEVQITISPESETDPGDEGSVFIKSFPGK
jgi:hypothetical protein